MKMVCGERFLVLMLGNTVEERLVNSFTKAGTSGWSALISWRHHRELRWTQLYGLPVSPCMMIMKIMNTFITKSYFSLEQSLTHTHTHRFSTNFGDFNGGFDGWNDGGFDGWNGCVCVLPPDIWVLFFLGSVGGDHSWIDLSCHQKPSLKYPSIGPFPTFSRLVGLEYFFRRSAWIAAQFFFVRTWKAKCGNSCWFYGWFPVA